jgi:hypothetical protein
VFEEGHAELRSEHLHGRAPVHSPRENHDAGDDLRHRHVQVQMRLSLQRQFQEGQLL